MVDRQTANRLVPPPAATLVFGERLPLAVRYAELLARHGMERGLIGPREMDRLWDRHLLNSAVVSEWLPERSRVVDLGSGAGLPGIPLAISRPDLNITLLEPMARRITWLEYVMMELELAVTVVRGRAEEPGIKRRVGGADVVTARAVAPLRRLSEWALPLLRRAGPLVAFKGAGPTDCGARALARGVTGGG